MVLEVTEEVSTRMTKVSVTVHRDDEDRPVLIIVKRGRKQLHVELEYAPLSDGLSNLYQMRLHGRRDMMPSFGEIIQTIQELTEIQPLTKYGLDRLREEYNRQLLGVGVWLTPTIIPQFTEDERNRGLAVQGGDVIIQKGLMYIPPDSRVILQGNINFGTLMQHRVKWGIQPQVGANRSVGFDNPDWFEFIGFWMDGIAFKARTKNYVGSTVTDLTAKFPADAHNTFHQYNIQWQSASVRFFIDGTLEATHNANIPQMPAGLDWRNHDSIAGDMVIQKGLELEQYRFKT